MSFDGTTRSLASFAADLSIKREKRLQALLSTYEHQLETEGQTPDPSLLEQAETLLQERLHAMPVVDQELAHLGDVLYDYLQRWEQMCQLLWLYRAQSLPTYEEAWARWGMIDCLALQRHCAAVVEQQPAFLDWATLSLPLEECLFVMNDATQAFCWHVIGQQERWFSIFEDLMARVSPTAQNREDRFSYIRTAINLALRANMIEKANSLLPSLYQLIQEDPAWEGNDDLLLETRAVHIELLGVTQQVRLLRQVGKETTDHLTTWISRFPEPSLSQKRCIRRLCHNIASSLYEAHQYEQAIPLFQQAIAYGVTAPHTYLWLAACVWMTTHEPSPVYALLRQAREHDASGKVVQTFWTLPELEELFHD